MHRAVPLDIDRRSAVRALSELVREDDVAFCLSGWGRTCLNELIRYFDPAGDADGDLDAALARARQAVQL